MTEKEPQRDWRKLPREQWTPAEYAEHQQELRERLRLHNEQEAGRKEERERSVKQEQLAAFLTARGKQWQEFTGGTAPPAELMQQWEQEFLDAQFYRGTDPLEKKRRERAERLY